VSQESRRGQVYQGVSPAAENIVTSGPVLTFTANDPPAFVQRAALRRLKGKPRENTPSVAQVTVNCGGLIYKTLER
jgi:hypothetical protein